MCTDYRRTQSYAQYVEAFSDTAFPLIFPEPQQAPNLMLQDEIRPTDPAPVFRRREHGVEMMTMRWGLVPRFHKGPLKGWRAMTVNARAESVATAPAFRDAFARRHCLVPADGWVEWKGAGKPSFFTRFTDAGDFLFVLDRLLLLVSIAVFRKFMTLRPLHPKGAYGVRDRRHASARNRLKII